MKRTLIIADDFLPDPLALRGAAIASDFDSPKWFQGVEWPGIGLAGQVDLTARIAETVGFPIKVEMAFFRMGKEGVEINSFIHADRVLSEWAGVLYLNTPDQCRGGTAFWRHKHTRTHDLNEYTTQIAKDCRPVEPNEIHREGFDESRWEMSGLAGMKFNRFIAYRSNLFHSRWPMSGWGETPDNARLVWVCFFNPAS